jgi:hypothetical protein
MFKKHFCHPIRNYPRQACEGLSIHIKISFNSLKKRSLICKNQKYNYKIQLLKIIYFKKIEYEIISNSLHARRMLLFDLVNFFLLKKNCS